MLAGCYVCVSVTDTGTGMTRTVLDRAFEPFYTTKPRSRGTGLGLAMVYAFAKHAGGTVRLYSEVGVGTTVSIYLPCATSEPTVELSKSALQRYARTSGIVLVVDDERELAAVAVACLKELGFDALEAHDGTSALEVLIQRDDIVLMITDIIMPGGLNGVELAQTARQLKPDLRIIYTSGFPAGALQEQSMAIVDGPLLRKPYQISEFNKSISEVMNLTN